MEIVLIAVAIAALSVGVALARVDWRTPPYWLLLGSMLSAFAAGLLWG